MKMMASTEANKSPRDEEIFESPSRIQCVKSCGHMMGSHPCLFYNYEEKRSLCQCIKLNLDDQPRNDLEFENVSTTSACKPHKGDVMPKNLF